jgi:hypothetical protein
MADQGKHLKTRFQVEVAFDVLFDDIELRVHNYLRSIQNSGLKREAMRDVASGFEVIKSLIENELQSLTAFEPRPVIVRFKPEKANRLKAIHDKAYASTAS